ncbi:hypothetical protein NQ317_012903 [Molorchus minor]|uniref:Intraflagellar transport protein 80 homolog n=1 Tax=Molorchus minor TaxID=1323400 RepID=A0ABQ9JR50_9CUCU|nr:hypothetical protein NQ317_012903 [Molorchus minor]
MRFKIFVSQKPSHSAPVTCVGWSSTEEVYSAGDDNQLLSWSVSTNQSTKITQFSNDIYPTDMQLLLPRISGAVGKHSDLILITSADGKFHILNRAGRVEVRSVEAHKGAILVGPMGQRWHRSFNRYIPRLPKFFPAGEDGLIKIWSRSGMLRSTVVSSDNSVYGACWSPDSQSIAYTQGKCLVVKQLTPNTKPLRWKAHDGLVLCLAWSPASGLIVSGGEDCKYRVWDSQGRQLFSSVLHDNHITSIAWTPAGDLFAIGSYNTLRLCDYSGWSRSLEKPNTGCIYKLAWSGDGTQLAAACANGQVLFAHVVGREVHYMNFTALVSERKLVTVRNVLDETVEQLELPERVIQLALRYNHLVVTTPAQCYIYNTSNWNTPAIFELKDGSVIMMLLCEKQMLLVEKSTVGIYNYQGRLTASPRWPNMRLDQLRNAHVSLSPDTLAVQNAGDMKRDATSIQHSLQIIQLSLDQCGEPSTRTLAILDKTRDLYLVQIRSSHKARKIDSFQWNANGNIIAGIQETQLIVWYCPTARFNAKLLKLCSLQINSPELGRSPKISDFVGNSVSIRRADGALLNVPISPFPSLIHKALDLAIKHKTHIDTVLYLRQKYIDNLGKNENNNKFSTLKETVRVIFKR